VQVTYRFRIQDPVTLGMRQFVFEASVPYPQVPRIGEGVVVPTAYQGESLGTSRIDAVIYDPYGNIILDLLVDGLVNNFDMQVQILLNAGFRELPPA
jgi:hypothetical protein